MLPVQTKDASGNDELTDKRVRDEDGASKKSNNNKSHDSENKEDDKNLDFNYGEEGGGVVVSINLSERLLVIWHHRR